MYLTEPTSKKWKKEKLKSKKTDMLRSISWCDIARESWPESEPEGFRLNSHISRLRAHSGRMHAVWACRMQMSQLQRILNSLPVPGVSTVDLIYKLFTIS